MFLYFSFRYDVVLIETNERMDGNLESGGKKKKVAEATSETGTTPTTNTLATVTASKHHVTMETKRSASPDPDDESEVISLSHFLITIVVVFGRVYGDLPIPCCRTDHMLPDRRCVVPRYKPELRQPLRRSQ